MSLPFRESRLARLVQRPDTKQFVLPRLFYACNCNYLSCIFSKKHVTHNQLQPNALQRQCVYLFKTGFVYSPGSVKCYRICSHSRKKKKKKKTNISNPPLPHRGIKQKIRTFKNVIKTSKFQKGCSIRQNNATFTLYQDMTCDSEKI
jgi:hypothetical protein